MFPNKSRHVLVYCTGLINKTIVEFLSFVNSKIKKEYQNLFPRTQHLHLKKKERKETGAEGR